MTWKISLFAGNRPEDASGVAGAGYAQKKIAEFDCKVAEFTKQAVEFGKMSDLTKLRLSQDFAAMAKPLSVFERFIKPIVEANMKQIFTVYEVANGFVAEVEGGGTVIGKTLSETCDAAQAQTAHMKIQGDDVAPKGSTVSGRIVEKFKWK
jgi:hypothetical protein